MSTPDADVRRRTPEVVAIVNDTTLLTPEAVGRARTVLTPLPGFGTGDALASTVCHVSAPGRLAIYDRRAHDAVHALGFDLDHRAGRYRRSMASSKPAGQRFTTLATIGTPAASIPRPTSSAARAISTETDRSGSDLLSVSSSASCPTAQRDWRRERTALVKSTSQTGRRYLTHREGGTHVVLFVRDSPSDDIGAGAPFLCLGTCRYVSHHGERPIAVTWKLDRDMPGETFPAASVVAS